ncbi:hypothetical protein GGQ99_001349 [Aminobacter niigataensis]|uniref:Uncharacterized protein n=1 Tax=Aminobacter niigataensis TaxID=83265 RepID=A0ABR6KYM1_9HYPH|nr:hypothetical protein [Aminobacter niigataensis]MBB4649627.1 hypothetical protein [Aminobacter niigataensis]
MAEIAARLREFPDYTTVNIGKHRTTFNKWVLEAADALDAKDKQIAELTAALSEIAAGPHLLSCDKAKWADWAADRAASSLPNKEDRNG